ncbi:hypothetical protein BKG91_02750 [Rodentibacter caecimuris]|uniref:Lipoprotein n=1 Tax=Rodentibacter caecimuris TaxID=1796644 RepID=A0AAJ3K3N9_9PAST|nr:hypothetical protein [Rodentibacter heylii]AOF53390.1 Large exoproteins involved in heme utilization or adhesion [Pasteurellaceae bacterium NI1060]MCQ9124069.1 hypothetical protein [Rodentibacter heylii]OOF71997.1 hypothetical protein BKG90_06100 [Rodentibacter heylii]OOF75636.1 hypothetical protein BKG91_02750 [Rodentibacter heylii]OOF77351.1 hypothetical protein BKG99_03290 [Rodentibacter heylii]
MKKKNQILVTLSIVALLGGCSEEEVQRDVYHSLDDCLADWKKIELCEADKTTENTQTQAQNANQQSQNGNSLSGLGLRNNGENTNNNEWQNANQTQTEQNNATGETSANVESDDPSLGAAIAGGVMGYVAAQAISNFLGPSYHPGNRAVSTPSGQVIQPQTNRSVGKPMLVKGKAGSMNSKPIARGGFSSPSHSNRSSGG